MKVKVCSSCSDPFKPIYKARSLTHGVLCYECWMKLKLSKEPKTGFLERVAPLIQEITVAHLKMKGAVEKSKRTPINKVSDKQAKINAAYSVLRKQFLKDNEFCRVQIPNECTNMATQIHHQSGRIGKLMLDQSEWLPICATCHRYVEENVSWSKEWGYSHNRLDK